LNTLLLALRFAKRDWRSGELRLLMLALVVAVAALTAVGFFTDRVERAMVLQANEILAADLVISGSTEIPQEYQQQAETWGLSTSRTLSFPSIVMRDDRTQLVEVKAVDAVYPLRGALRTRITSSAPEELEKRPPAPGNVWAEARLLAELSIKPGTKISLGESRFALQTILSRDSAAGRNIFRLGPELLMRLEDIPKTELITPASRVRHQLLIAGDERTVERYHLWASGRLPTGFGVEQMSNARPELRSALDRGGNFLSLAALVAVLVAGATIALSTRRFVELQSDISAIMRCLGAQQSLILKVLLVRLFLLASTASLLGVLIGFLGQDILATLLTEWFGSALPAPSIWPAVSGLATGFITLAGFTLPSALQLGKVPPLRVLRRDIGAPPTSSWILIASSVAAMALLMFWQANDPVLALWVLLGTTLAILLLMGSALLLLKSLASVRQKSGSYWRYGLTGLTRNPALTTFQLTGFGLGILALLLLTFVRVDLLAAWQKTVPADAPNQFLINIQPQKVDTLQAFFTQHDIPTAGFYPMLRARLMKINGRTVSTNDYKEEQSKHLVAREFNLSWAQHLQTDNQIVSGQWWSPATKGTAQLSVEIELAKKLRIKLGDTLTFNLAGTPISANVTSLRSVQWGNFQPNFYVIGTPSLLQGQPSTFITSFHLPAGKEKLLTLLTQQFPAVTAIDVSAIMTQIREIIGQGSKAVEYVFLFTIVAGLLMFYAGIQATRELRRQESAILRTLGMQRTTLLASAVVEFVTLGVLAGILASTCASLIGWALATEVFEFPYHFNMEIWLTAILSSGFGIGLAGLLAAYPLTIRPPLQTLQGR